MGPLENSRVYANLYTVKNVLVKITKVWLLELRWSVQAVYSLAISYLWELLPRVHTFIHVLRIELGYYTHARDLLPQVQHR